MGIFRKAYKFARRLFGGRRKKRIVRRARVRKTLKRAVHRPFVIKKTVILDKIQVNCGATVAQNITAELSDIPQFASYTNLYDQYKLLKVKVHYRSLNPVNLAQVNAPTAFHVTLGMIHSVVDYTDSVPIASLATLLNDDSYFSTKSSRDHIRVFRPKYLDVIAGGVPGRSAKSTWLHTDAPAVSHYGLKTLFEGGIGPGGYPSFFVEPIITYYFAFKDQKN